MKVLKSRWLATNLRNNLETLPEQQLIALRILLLLAPLGALLLNVSVLVQAFCELPALTLAMARKECCEHYLL